MTYQEFKQAVIRCSQELGVRDYELYYAVSASTTVEIFQQEVSKYLTENSMGVCYRLVQEGKAGYASTENLTEEEARSLVVRALENMKSMENEEEAFIHEKGDSYLTLPDGEGAQPTGTELVEAALTLQREMYDADPRVSDGTQSYMVAGSETYALYNSKGLDLEDQIPGYAICLGMALIAADGEMYSGNKLKDGSLRDFDLKEIAGKAVEEAASTVGADSVPSGKYNVVFTGEAFADLLNTYSSIFSAEAAQKGMSLLNGKEGEKIGADIVTIVDDPLYKDSVIKRTFDGEGVATYRKNVVENGCLKTLLHNLSTAAKAGVKSTGNGQKASYASNVGVGPFTFYLKPVKGSREELLAEAGEGVCIKEVSGLHAGANPLTGDFSLLASGFRIQAGKKTSAVKNITVSGNFYSLLKEIDRIGEELEFSGMGIKCGSPSVLVRNMTIAGKG